MRVLSANFATTTLTRRAQPSARSFLLLDVGACAQVPKYIMASGNLVKVHPRMSIEHRLGSIAFTRAALCMKVLIHTGTADYMEYKPVDGSFVYRCSIPVAGLCNTVVPQCSCPHNRSGATRCQQLASVRPRPYAPARSSAVCSDSP